MTASPSGDDAILLSEGTEERSGWRHAVARVDLGALAPIIFFIVMIVAFGAAEPEYFLTSDNLTSILNNGAVTALIACGLTVVLIVGEFDLSIAAAASFGGGLAAVSEGIKLRARTLHTTKFDGLRPAFEAQC